MGKNPTLLHRLHPDNIKKNLLYYIMNPLFLHRLKISQLKKLVDRYSLQPPYRSRWRKRDVIIYTLAKYMKTNGIGECPICFESNTYETVVITNCTHIYCDMCLIQHLEQNYTCPMCRESIDVIDILCKISSHRLKQLGILMKKKKETNLVELDIVSPLHIQVYASLYILTFVVSLFIFILLEIGYIILDEIATNYTFE